MYLFEAAWQDNWDYYERVYDTQLKRSIKRKIDARPEYYVESTKQNPLAHYKYILDQDRVFEKQTRPKKGMGEEYGYQDALYSHIRDNYWNVDMFQTKYNNKTRYWCLDIETRSGVHSTGFPVPNKALEEITMFQIFDSEINELILLGTKDWKHKDHYVEKFHEKYTGSNAVNDIKFINCKDEITLINTYFKLFQKLDPTIIYAWNGNNFDFPYIHNRLKRLGMDTNLMSNYGSVTYKEREFQGSIKYTINSQGHFYVDMMEVYKKFTFHPMTGYSLDNVAEYELNENKVNHDEYERFDDFYSGNYTIPQYPTDEQRNSEIYKQAVAGNIQEVRDLSYSLFCYYGCIDTYLIERLIRKLKFHDILVMLSSKMGVMISDSMGTVKPWSQFLSNVALLENIIMPPKQEHPQPDVVGGYVRKPEHGIIRWILSEDVNSMYPLLGMVAFNMSPETFVPIYKLPDDIRDIIIKYYTGQDESKRFEIPSEIKDYLQSKLKEYGYSLGINGAVFSHEKLGIIPKLVLEIYNGRKTDKKTMFKFEQAKIHMSDYLKHRT